MSKMMRVSKSPKKSRKNGAQNSAKRKSKPRGKGRPFVLGNPWRFPKGKSGNPGGRPKSISDAYREWLEAEDQNGVTNASKIAINIGFRAALGDVQSAKEIRSATEGEFLTLTDLAKQKEIADDARSELARRLSRAAAAGGEGELSRKPEPGTSPGTVV